ncbi:hypothetical protein [Actinomadura litoris]|uniref:hypothetical protein n=1 Tax=Actinomadura litoris TaxID=2678616 RepID=UPI001FA6FF80|nr:hypothetical protein [Actinomadura litoris]
MTPPAKRKDNGRKKVRDAYPKEGAEAAKEALRRAEEARRRAEEESEAVDQ